MENTPYLALEILKKQQQNSISPEANALCLCLFVGVAFRLPVSPLLLSFKSDSMTPSSVLHTFF